ncbi:hypothetical protein HMPREF3034_00297 [Prevotella sp. DNF00663]|nr:hypothetical protein HMPREF3034_00297 [Prevotella sp. DNF00663]
MQVHLIIILKNKACFGCEVFFAYLCALYKKRVDAYFLDI